MSLFARREVRTANLAATLVAEAAAGRTGTHAGVSVTTDSAQRLSAVWGSVRVIADTIATMPWTAYRGEGAGRQTVSPSPSLIVRPASANRPRLIGWRRQLVHSLLLRGNAYGILSGFDSLGRNPQRLDLIHPDSVTWRQDRDGWAPWIGNARQDLWPLGDLWHVSAYEVAGVPFGLNPLEYARQTIGAGLAAEKFGADFFGEGGHPSAIVYSDVKLTKDQASAIKEAVVSATQGSREPAVMGAGLRWQQIQVSPEDSQFVDSQKFSAQQIAGAIFGVPPEMLGFSSSGESVTYANVTDRDLFFLKYGLSPWLARIQEALSELLPQPQYVRFNTGALLRADIKTRAETYKAFAEVGTALGEPVILSDEIREMEDWSPLPKTGGAPGA